MPLPVAILVATVIAIVVVAVVARIFVGQSSDDGSSGSHRWRELTHLDVARRIGARPVDTSPVDGSETAPGAADAPLPEVAAAAAAPLIAFATVQIEAPSGAAVEPDAPAPDAPAPDAPAPDAPAPVEAEPAYEPAAAMDARPVVRSRSRKRRQAEAPAEPEPTYVVPLNDDLPVPLLPAPEEPPEPLPAPGGGRGSRLRVWRDAAAVLLVMCLAVLAVSLFLPGSTDQPTPSASPTAVALASDTPAPSDAPLVPDSPSPQDSATPMPSESPGVTDSPSPSVSPTPTPTPTPTPPPTAPGTPSRLAAVATGDAMSLSWSAPGSNGGSPITAYQLYRGGSSGTEVYLGSAGKATSYNDRAVSPGGTYYYYVRAVNVAGVSGPSGEVHGTIPIAAPGAPTLVSAVATGTSIALTWTPPTVTGGSAISGYDVFRSTSPGAEALVKSLGVVTTYTDTGLPRGQTYYYVVRAVNAAGPGTQSSEKWDSIAAIAPGAPTSVTAVPGDASAQVSWLAPASDGGSAITLYTVTSSPGNFTCTSSGLSCTVGTLANATPYTFTVKATNGAGTGAASAASSPVTPYTTPGAPTAVQASPGDGSVLVSWTAPAFNGGSSITGYTVAASSGGQTCTTLGALSCTVSGLANGTSYTFTVTAANAAGPGPASAPSATATPRTTPDAPTGVSGSPGQGVVLVSWAAPSSDGGASITSYTATSSPGGFTCTTAGLSCTVSGLTNGQGYTFTVRATNPAGAGPASIASGTVTPAAVKPGAPTGVSGIAGNGSVGVSWNAPSSDGGATITLYTVTSSPDNKTCTTGGALSCTVSGLTNGQAYTFSVVATNSAGDGAASTDSSPVTPRTVPDAPALATIDNSVAGQIAITWTAPAFDGGASISSYQVWQDIDGGGYVKIATVSGATLDFTDGAGTALTATSTYSYYVVAVNAAGPSANSNVLSAVAQ